MLAPDQESPVPVGRTIGKIAQGAQTPAHRTVFKHDPHFMRFRNSKVVENLSLIDSYDAVEQVLGHSLADSCAEPADDDVLVRV